LRSAKFFNAKFSEWREIPRTTPIVVAQRGEKPRTTPAVVAQHGIFEREF
jgi:hypothetical protein